MGDTTIRIPLDNYVQNGDDTLNELIASVAAVNGGIKPSVADPVRDPATGKLIRVNLTLPDGAADAAATAINSNPAAKVEAGCPEQLYARELNDAAPDGIVYSGALEAGALIQHISAAPLPTGNFGRLDGNGYIDGEERLSAAPVQMAFQNRSTTDDLVIATGDTLTLNISATQSLNISLNADLTIPKVVSAVANTIMVYVDVNGKLYTRTKVFEGEPVHHQPDYALACAEGAL